MTTNATESVADAGTRSGIYRTARLTILETRHARESFIGNINCISFVAWMTDEPAPTFIVATGLFASVRGGWVLSHLMVDDEHRRHGFASEIVSHYESRLGDVGACWVSESGEAFGNGYVAKHGARPHWRIGQDPELNALMDAVLARKAQH